MSRACTIRLGLTAIMQSAETPFTTRPIRAVDIAAERAHQARDDVRVRLMRADETDAVSELVERAYSTDFRLSDAYRADIVAVAERARDHQVWVATDAASGMLLGTVSTPRPGRAISPLAREGELDFRFLGVAAEARRRGIGELLVEHVMRLARVRGLDRVVLNTGPDMVSAQRLYARLGFARLHEREFVFERPDGSSFLMLAYGRDLAPDGRVDGSNGADSPDIGPIVASDDGAA